jgi:hypothetical protein
MSQVRPIAAIEMKPVTSSQIKAIGHDEATHTLRVQFVKGEVFWRYENVTKEIHSLLMTAQSIGAFFTANIKKHPELYPAHKEETTQPESTPA